MGDFFVRRPIVAMVIALYQAPGSNAVALAEEVRATMARISGSFPKSMRYDISLDTERTLFNVQLQRSELQQKYSNAYVKLYKALGGGWVTTAERQAQAFR